MKNFFKGKLGTAVILFFTLILAGVAVFTALRLYELRSQSVAPNVPSSIPQAAENKAPSSCSLTFTLTKNLQCNSACNQQDSPAQCGQGLSCLNTSGNPNTLILKCRNPQCSSQTDCLCGTSTPTPTPTPTGNVTPTATPTATPTGVPNSCNGTCGSNANCGSGLYCNTSVGFCRNPSCPDATNCSCGTVTPTPTPTGTTHVNPTPTPTAPALPSSGTDWPTVVGAGIGIFIIAGSLLLAL